MESEMYTVFTHTALIITEMWNFAQVCVALWEFVSVKFFLKEARLKTGELDVIEMACSSPK